MPGAINALGMDTLKGTAKAKRVRSVLVLPPWQKQGVYFVKVKQNKAPRWKKMVRGLSETLGARDD